MRPPPPCSLSLPPQPIERVPKLFRPLKVPASLQAALPFKSKPKGEAAGGKKGPSLQQKRPAVVMEAGERRVVAMLHQLNAIRNEKVGEEGRMVGV